MRTLLGCTCLTPILVLAHPMQAQAQTVIDSAITNPVRTSTVDDGSRDDIWITEDGSIRPTSGVAVTIDSNNDVDNEGTIAIQDANNAIGIRALAGNSGDIVNDGTITIDEDYTAEDDDDDGDIDGRFALGSGRYGILIEDGGAFRGDVDNGGTISIEGNESGAIVIESRLEGGLDHSGTITVVGDDSFGIHTIEITDSVTITGGVNVRGENAVGVALDGDVGGRVTFQNSVTVTGFRSVPPPSDTDDLDADDLLIGGPAVRIAGDVDGGILFDAPPPDRDEDDDDEDDDGIDDDEETTAIITSHGSAAAVEIGSADTDIVIGALADNADGHAIVIRGTVSGEGIYEGVDANGLVIGGLGRTVDIAGGMRVTGRVRAVSNDGNATALRLGEGASTGEIVVNGEVLANGGSRASTAVRAIAIDAGASVEEIRNIGSIVADTDSDARTFAIVDRSGTVERIRNTGLIAARGGAEGRNIAIDLRANADGATVRQLQLDEDAAAPRLIGDVQFGDGDDRFEITAGTVTGDTVMRGGDDRFVLGEDAEFEGDADFGAGDDELALDGTARFAGDADFGAGANRLSLAGDAVFRGAIANSGSLDLVMDGGMLDVTNSGRIALASMTLGEDSMIGVTIDEDAGTNTLYDVSGTARFAEGSAVMVRVTELDDVGGEFVVIRADTLEGAENLSDNSANLPFLLQGGLSVDEQAGEISVAISRKPTEALGLNGSQSRAFDAIFAALSNDEEVADVYLSIFEGEAFRSTLRQMLPDHAGGTFETASQGSRATARFLSDPSPAFSDQGGWGFWIQQVNWGTSSDFDDTAAYDLLGWGITGGAEVKAGEIGNFGLSLAYLFSEVDDEGTLNFVDVDQFEAAAYWRGQWGGFQAHARASIAQLDFDGTREFNGRTADEEIVRKASGSWDGRLYSLSAGMSYEFGSGRLRLRPVASIDYYNLHEDGYAETGGGDAFNLTVDERTSDELAATARLVASLHFGDDGPAAGWMRVEIDGGRRQILAGDIGETTARFADGEDFTLVPEERTDGWVGALRVIGGRAGFSIGGEFSAEEQQDRFVVGLRASLRVGF
ncbi:MAG: autotransporter domain-containing protein [Pseudomonadota bacterium]